MAGLTEPNNADDFHVTVMYSKHRSISDEVALAINKPNEVYAAEVTGFDILGGDALVILLDSRELQLRYQELSVFLDHSFDEYLPHLSVKYGASQDDLTRLKAMYDRLNTTFPIRRIQLSGERIEPCKTS